MEHGSTWLKVKVPLHLHRSVKAEAAILGLSLQTYVTHALTALVASRQPEAEEATANHGTRAKRDWSKAQSFVPTGEDD